GRLRSQTWALLVVGCSCAMLAAWMSGLLRIPAWFEETWFGSSFAAPLDGPLDLALRTAALAEILVGGPLIVAGNRLRNSPTPPPRSRLLMRCGGAFVLIGVCVPVLHGRPAIQGLAPGEWGTHEAYNFAFLCAVSLGIVALLPRPTADSRGHA